MDTTSAVHLQGMQSTGGRVHSHLQIWGEIPLRPVLITTKK